MSASPSEADHPGWSRHIFVNIYWLGLNVASGIITPVLLPYLVALFVVQAQKNTYLATIRVIGLAVAMFVQPLAGMLSDRSTLRWGRRRPFIAVGTILDLIFLALIAVSPRFIGSSLDETIRPLFGVSTAYIVLLIGIVLLQISSNFAQGALQGLLPDLIPDHQRGRSSGVKAVFELLPAFLIIFIGPLVDAGEIGWTVGIIAAALTLTMLLTLLFAHETPQDTRPVERIGSRALRLLALSTIFVAVSQAAVWLVRSGGSYLSGLDISLGLQVTLIGLAGLAAMAGSILLGVYLGAWVGIGEAASQHKSFIWWVINRLLFLAAIGSIQGFAQFYIADVLHAEEPATVTTLLLAVVALFLIPSALGGGYLADRIGRRVLVGFAGLACTLGTCVLLISPTLTAVIVGGCILGLGAGTFMATSWALGTDLAPAGEAGRYLGISNLAGAGAGIVGAGIGGPLADFFNQIQPGLGYLVIFAAYAGLFLLSVLVLRWVPEPALLRRSST
ncbi:MAG: MFS transporter [Anaerolineales bacterium]